MLDFSKLLSTLSEEVKRKPNQKPVGQLLPSEMALDDVRKGAEESVNASVLPPEPSQGSPMTESPLGLGEQQLRATQEGIADEPANADNVYLNPLSATEQTAIQGEPLVAPRVDRNRKPSLQEDITAREQELRSATDAPVEKQSWWKDFGAKLVQGADAFFNGNRAPIVGWGKLKHDYAVKQAEGKLNPLLAMQKQQLDTEGKQAANDIAKIKPEMMQREIERKVRKDQTLAKYNDLRIKLGQQKADDWRWAQEQLDAHRDGTLQVSQERLKQLQQIIDNTENWRKVQDENKDADRALKGDTATKADAQKTADRKEKVKQWVASQKLTKVALQSQIDERIKAGTLTPEAGKQMMADAFDQ